eukprot:gene1982-2999_t
MCGECQRLPACQAQQCRVAYASCTNHADHGKSTPSVSPSTHSTHSTTAPQHPPRLQVPHQSVQFIAQDEDGCGAACILDTVFTAWQIYPGPVPNEGSWALPEASALLIACARAPAGMFACALRHPCPLCGCPGTPTGAGTPAPLPLSSAADGEPCSSSSPTGHPPLLRPAPAHPQGSSASYVSKTSGGRIYSPSLPYNVPSTAAKPRAI